MDDSKWSTESPAGLSSSGDIHTCQYKATDNTGNVTETPIQRLNIDTIAPVIEMDEELKLGETIYYDLEDPTVAGQENSGLYIYRAVIEDDDENYEKIVLLDVLTGDKAIPKFSTVFSVTNVTMIFGAV